MANIFSKHRRKMRAQSKKQKDKPELMNELSVDQVGDKQSVQDHTHAGGGALLNCQILSLSHEGRGIAKNKGKTQFVHYALPGEQVLAELVAHRSKYDELKAVKVLHASNQRVEPKCRYFGECGGCSLQHMKHGGQLKHKASVLIDQLKRFGDVSPIENLAPVESDSWAYRSRTKLSVDYGRKGEALRLGYRKKASKEILDIESCPVLNKRLSEALPELKEMIVSLPNASASGKKVLGHLELSSSNEGVSVLVRAVNALETEDKQYLAQFAQERQWRLYLQESDVSSIYPLWPAENELLLSYDLALKGKQISLYHHPKDFTQINQGVNQKMVQLAIDMLDLQAQDRTLDLFSGLGNFTLAMAEQSEWAVGVEGSEEMVVRGRTNAKRNKIENVAFYESNLYGDFAGQAWARETYDKILLDPPRAGAEEIVRHIGRFKAKRIVYISCNPATLARDAGILADQGYQLSCAGILDMFPHTEHLESITVFDSI